MRALEHRAHVLLVRDARRALDDSREQDVARRRVLVAISRRERQRLGQHLAHDRVARAAPEHAGGREVGKPAGVREELPDCDAALVRGRMLGDVDGCPAVLPAQRGALNDPRQEFVTITAVKISQDMQIATVYFRTYNDADSKRAQKGLESASAFLRRQAN